jgi:hypothetical protein
MRRTHSLVVLALVAGVLAGCADRPGGPAEPEAPPPGAGAAPEKADPIALIGDWTLADAGEDSGKVLRLSADIQAIPGGGLELWRSCGSLMGEWRATAGGLFLGETNAASGCPAGTMVTPDWLDQAAAFKVDGDERVLLDVQGNPVARLTPGGKPPADAASGGTPPKVRDGAAQDFAPPAALPAGLVAADAAALTGRWVPTGAAAPDKAYAEFLADGSWRGSDGCNGQGGRWLSGAEGAFLATTGPSTLIACDNVPIATWLGEARRSGLDGEILVLLDANAKELGRLQPVK